MSATDNNIIQALPYSLGYCALQTNKIFFHFLSHAHKHNKTHTHSHQHTQTYKHTHKQTGTYVHRQTHIHMYTQTHTHTNTHTNTHTISTQTGCDKVTKMPRKIFYMKSF